MMPAQEKRHPHRSPARPLSRQASLSAALRTPEARQHADEAREIEKALRGYGIEPDRVAPTLDFEGHVRLDFDAVATLLDMLDQAYQGQPPDLEKI